MASIGTIRAMGVGFGTKRLHWTLVLKLECYLSRLLEAGSLHMLDFGADSAVEVRARYCIATYSKNNQMLHGHPSL